MKLIGNENIMRQLTLARFAAMVKDTPLPHTLLTGAAGCGKTSTARYIAKESNGAFISVGADSIKTRNDVLNVIDQFDKRGYNKYGDRIKDTKISFPILFIDEIHRLSIVGQEHLGIAMEEWKVPIDNKQVKVSPYDKFGGETKNRNSRWCPYFTLIGATTNDGLLSKPFKDRCKLRFTFNIYTVDESIEIVKLHANRLGVKVSDGAANEIAIRGRGVPRIIVGLLERCVDFAISISSSEVTVDTAKSTFVLMRIDDNGLGDVDISILKTLYTSTEPIGVDNIAIMVNESKQVLSETIEPYLIQNGLIYRTSRGRMITEKGKNYLITGGHIKHIDKESWVDIPNDYERTTI